MEMERQAEGGWRMQTENVDGDGEAGKRSVEKMGGEGGEGGCRRWVEKVGGECRWRRRGWEAGSEDNGNPRSWRLDLAVSKAERSYPTPRVLLVKSSNTLN